jgi:hypothetical protein
MIAAISGGGASSCEPRQRGIGGQNAVAQTGEIARAAASDRQPRQRARHVGRGAQRGAESSRAALSATKRAIASSRRAIRALSVSGAPAAAPAAAIRRGHGAVDGIEQRAAPLAGSVRVSSRLARVADRSPWWCRRPSRDGGDSGGPLSDLRAVDIGDGRGGGGGLQPRHRAEPSIVATAK